MDPMLGLSVALSGLAATLAGAAFSYLLWFARKFDTWADGYAAEKGKNVATKEDLDSVHRAIEEMKKEVGVAQQAHVDTDRAEREALVAFLDALMHFTLDAVPEVGDVVAVVVEGGNPPVAERRREVRRSYAELMATYSRAIVFCGHDELRRELIALAGDAASLNQNALVVLLEAQLTGAETDADARLDFLKGTFVPYETEANGLNREIRQRYSRVLQLGNQRLDGRVEATSENAFEQVNPATERLKLTDDPAGDS